MEYFENIKNERWLMGENKISFKDRLYLFVKYGNSGIIAS